MRSNGFTGHLLNAAALTGLAAMPAWSDDHPTNGKNRPKGTTKLDVTETKTYGGSGGGSINLGFGKLDVNGRYDKTVTEKHEVCRDNKDMGLQNGQASQGRGQANGNRQAKGGSTSGHGSAGAKGSSTSGHGSAGHSGGGGHGGGSHGSAGHSSGSGHGGGGSGHGGGHGGGGGHSGGGHGGGGGGHGGGGDGHGGGGGHGRH
jgi:hypothetical protein